MQIILYSTGCPKCNVLKSKLDSANVSYTVCDNMNCLIELGFTNVPILKVDGVNMEFTEAVKWINEREIK